MFLMNQRIHWNGKARARIENNEMVRNADLRPRPSCQTSETCGKATMLYTSTMGSQDLVVCRASTSDLEQANSCCCFMQMTPNSTFLLNGLTWFNAIPALKVTNRN